MTLFEAYDAILTLASSDEVRVARMRVAFEQRTGEFRPEDPWFEARSRAFWDDALTAQGLAREVALELEGSSSPVHTWAEPLARAHRGLFVVTGGGPREATAPWTLRDLWGGATFAVHLIDDATRDALAAASAPFDARLAGADDPPRVGILPGAVFHPADAAEPIAAVLARARQEGRRGPDVLDALLRMERGLRASARVKAAYAYRADKLGAPLRH